MKIAIIVWNKDLAGLNVKQNLLEHFNFKKTEQKYDNSEVYQFDDNTKLYTIATQHVNAENIDKNIQADIFIFATTHKSSAGTYSLSVHTPGNWNKAELGGKERKLCTAIPSLVKNIYLEQKRLNTLEDYKVTLECTHHGPYLEKPAIFVEIGSEKEQWENKEAGKINAEAIINAIKNKNKYKIALGLGGPHYCDNFNKILERTDIAIGHICPKYAIESLDEEMLKQAIEKNNQKVDLVILDWKGLGKEKSRIVEMLKKLNIEFKRSDKIK